MKTTGNFDKYKLYQFLENNKELASDLKARDLVAKALEATGVRFSEAIINSARRDLGISSKHIKTNDLKEECRNTFVTRREIKDVACCVRSLLNHFGNTIHITEDKKDTLERLSKLELPRSE